MRVMQSAMGRVVATVLHTCRSLVPGGGCTSDYPQSGERGDGVGYYLVKTSDEWELRRGGLWKDAILVGSESSVRRIKMKFEKIGRSEGLVNCKYV